jgi:hypothetical protein
LRPEFPSRGRGVFAPLVRSEGVSLESGMKPWLVMICFYFGRWPAWIDFFIESCKWNPHVRWRIYTDCGVPENKADNVDIVHVSFDDYKAMARERLGVAFDPADRYKICDLRPALGFLHEQDVADFPFFGYGDIDVIYGDISQFYDESRLDQFDVVSTHPERVSGHFAIFRNTHELRGLFEAIPGYRQLLEEPHQTSVEEIEFSRLILNATALRTLFVERHSTVLSARGWHDGTMNYPQRWFWKHGKLTNAQDGDREFLYLHFMRWQSAHWINDPPAPGEAAWVGREIIHADWRKAASEGFCISPEGFTPVES